VAQNCGSNHLLAAIFVFFFLYTGAASSVDREREITDQLIAECLKTFTGAGFAAAAAALPPPSCESGDQRGKDMFGPHLHRWGSAFPTGKPLSASLAAVPEARVLFCGDYVATTPSAPSAAPPAQIGTAEAAILSGIQAASTLNRWLGGP